VQSIVISYPFLHRKKLENVGNINTFIMGLKRSEIIEYLIKEQGYDEKVVKEMEVWELVDLYQMFHED
jgi:hypothetical protein